MILAIVLVGRRYRGNDLGLTALQTASGFCAYVAYVAFCRQFFNVRIVETLDSANGSKGFPLLCGM